MSSHLSPAFALCADFPRTVATVAAVSLLFGCASMRAAEAKRVYLEGETQALEYGMPLETVWPVVTGRVSTSSGREYALELELLRRLEPARAARIEAEADRRAIAAAAAY